jgi:hypothetical protein
MRQFCDPNPASQFAGAETCMGRPKMADFGLRISRAGQEIATKPRLRPTRLLRNPADQDESALFRGR